MRVGRAALLVAMLAVNGPAFAQSALYQYTRTQTYLTLDQAENELRTSSGGAHTTGSLAW